MDYVSGKFKFVELEKSELLEENIVDKKVSRIIATVMLFLAVAFLWYALNHPEGAFPWSNTITFALYRLYIIAMIILYIAPFKKS